MKHGNWIPLDKNLVSFLPKNRPYTELEAMFSYSVDQDNNITGTIKGYADLWGWSRNKVRVFLSKIKGHLKDTKRTLKGHQIRFINNDLQEQKDTKGTLKGHLKDTTIYPNPNPKKEKNIFMSPENSEPSEALLKWLSQEEYWQQNSKTLIEACFDHHKSKGNKIKDWEAAIRTWCRNDKKFNPHNYTKGEAKIFDPYGFHKNYGWPIEEMPSDGMPLRDEHGKPFLIHYDDFIKGEKEKEERRQRILGRNDKKGHTVNDRMTT